MSKQLAVADRIRRAMHDNLVKELRLRQRNIVFPDTVRNWGVFYRNLTSNSIYAYRSHRIFAFFWALFLLIRSIYYLLGNFIFITTGDRILRRAGWLGDVDFAAEWFLWMAVSLKVAVHAVVREEQPKQHRNKSYPGVKI